MAKHSNIVRFQVKPGQQEAFEAIARAAKADDFPGQELITYVKTGPDTYCAFGIWESEAAMVAARPAMIAYLNTCRHLLAEISPELGVTDPVSGTVFHLEGAISSS